ncbi:MAG: nucleoside-diphosphate kinase [Frankiaceae bacterium]
MTQRTLVLLKPDAVRRGLIGDVVGRLERKGLALVAMDLRTVDRDTAARHYAEHAGKPFYEALLDFITGGPIVAAVVEGDEAIAVVRTLVGATDGRQAAPGTIRGDHSLSNRENLVHASDGADAATREIATFFPALPVLPAAPGGDN